LNRRAHTTEALTIDGPAGRLEALLEEPKQDVQGCRVAVLCHPHPQYQGTMMNKVVHTLARAINDLGMPALRFNFRGVGASDGGYGEGRGETDDALAVVTWVRQRYPGAELWLGGFSFGAMVAAVAALDAAPGQLISIAPPPAHTAEMLAGRQPDCRWLIVQGSADEVVDCDAVVDWVNTLAPGPELVVLPDVSHFFHGKLVLLRHVLTTHLQDREPGGK